MMHKLEDLVEKQRDALRAKDHELTLRNEDVEAVRNQIVLHQTHTQKQNYLYKLQIVFTPPHCVKTSNKFSHCSSRCSSIG